MAGSRSARFGAVMLLAVVASLILVADRAGAHAAYKFSDPDDESTVSQPPTEIWAEYTETPTDASYLKVFDPCGVQVDNGDSRSDPTQKRVYITMSGDKAGTYRVDWFVDSATDSHSTRGTFTFTVTDGEPCPGQAGERDEPDDRRSQARSGDEGADRRTGGGSDSVSEAEAPASERDRDQVGSVGDVERGERDARDRGRETTRRSGPADDRSQPAVAAPEPRDEPGLLTGIPIGGLALALAIAACIGAVGGFIYAGIMGYHRRPTA